MSKFGARSVAPPEAFSSLTLRAATWSEVTGLASANPALLEPGLEFLDQDVDLGRGRRLDLVLRDTRNQAVFVVFADTLGEDESLLLCLDIPHWITEVQPLLERIYAGRAVDFDGNLRILLLGTRFSARLRSRVENLLGHSIELVRVRMVEADGRIGLLAEPVTSSVGPVGLAPVPEADDFEDFSDYDAGRPLKGQVISADEDEEEEDDADDDGDDPTLASAEAGKILDEPGEKETLAPPSPSTDTLDELLTDGTRRIAALSDRIQTTQTGNSVRFLLDRKILAEIRRTEDGLQVFTDPTTSTGALRNTREFEAGLNRIITKFFRLEEKAASLAARSNPLETFAPAKLTEEEIAELYRQDPTEEEEARKGQGQAS
jgi:hypothetical protein